MTQFLRPDSNVTQTDFTGGFAEIDETSASDADYAVAAVAPDTIPFTRTLEVGLGNPAGTPAAGTMTVRYRAAKVDGGGPEATGEDVFLDVSLYQGASLIDSDVQRTLGGSYVDYSWTPDTSGISDWTDLRLRMVVTGGHSPSVPNRRGARISWAEAEVPDPSRSGFLVFF